MPRKPSAENSFREAFERLKTNTPQRLPKGSVPLEANVAREAGVSPSALKKQRFPSLVAEIQQWNKEREIDTSLRPRVSEIEGRQMSRSLREKIKALTSQRDAALSLLVSADSRILALTLECERLRAVENSSPVASFNDKRKIRN
ncbi:hypothetical protein QT562_08150 [Xanthomonas citri pv. citri]|uniref:Uncharacterized protein n=1 Tax=Xanthomonas axonopodis pv. citri (strain 306) TaxID=190486 RepID=A0AAI8ETD0_XANAC|nr:hypothetical protein [Xanthomonas citri]AAM38771.1 hypothetical protein XAC3934 [Xanthomonas citri pv. citri str. 306]AUZ53462.1 hypothetical protein CLM98_23175 [Xanthomonas citri pv. citri]MBD4861022.1 hypothetical protein [Xanthomonas citri pv. citri]MBD5028830.1 hypothetical protein [Xanthomonas citri pv. citri]MBD5035778.1 hypothetical protein [Xanthomonas citri pv. citri]